MCVRWRGSQTATRERLLLPLPCCTTAGQALPSLGLSDNNNDHHPTAGVSEWRGGAREAWLGAPRLLGAKQGQRCPAEKGRRPHVISDFRVVTLKESKKKQVR